MTRSGTVRGTGNGERINFLNLAMSKSFTLKHCDAERSGAGNGERIKYCNFAILQCGSALPFNIVTRSGSALTFNGAERGTGK